eukprot:gene5826-4153_t
MRHFRFMVIASGGVLCSTRKVSVGPDEGVLPRHTKVPLFGRRRRKEKKASDITISTATLIDENEARDICRKNYGFFSKPVYMEKWGTFLSELKRAELSWSVIPVSGGGMTLKLIDHSHHANEVLHEFRGRNSTQSSPLADLFEACGSIVNGSRQEENVLFNQKGFSEVLKLVPTEKEYMYPYIPPEGELGIPLLAKSECTRVSLDVLHLNSSNGVLTPLFRGLSFQAFCYAFLTSIPCFLKKTDVGVRNLDFVSQEQMTHFRYAWCYLRREAWMTPLEMEEFDALLPPK